MKLPAQDPVPPKRWTLDQRALDRLLRAFHPDREQASRIYEALHGRLARFFEWNHADSPQDLADETLDRLARRLSSEEDEPVDPARFAAGIARLLLKEHFRQLGRREAALTAMAEVRPGVAATEAEAALQEERMAVLDRCLLAIPDASRNLIERYFSSEGRAHSEVRQRLAEEQGISINALRNRAMRIRRELERHYSLLVASGAAPGSEMFHRKSSHCDGR